MGAIRWEILDLAHRFCYKCKMTVKIITKEKVDGNCQVELPMGGIHLGIMILPQALKSSPQSVPRLLGDMTIASQSRISLEGGVSSLTPPHIQCSTCCRIKRVKTGLKKRWDV